MTVCALYSDLLKTDSQTERQRKSKEEVTEFYMRTKTIMLQQHPHFLLTVISALLSHPTLVWARQLHQALRLLRIRREKGRQEGHLRGIDAWDIRALLTERCRRREERDRVQGKGKSIYHWIFFFFFWISEMIDYLFCFVCLSFSSYWYDVIKSCEKHRMHLENMTFCVIQPTAQINDITTFCRGGHHKTGRDTET